MHHVFVSYSRTDVEFVEDVVRRLEEQGHPVWIDRHDIPVSFPWLADVEDAIAAADLVAVFASPAQAASQACALECELAGKLAKRTLAVELAAHRPASAAALVSASLEQGGQDERLRTELTVRARAWERQGRPKSVLVSPRRRRALARAARSGSGPTPQTARRFLRAARRRNRRRRLAAASGIMVIGASLAAVETAMNARESADVRLAATDRAFELARLDRRTVERDIYRALAVYGKRGSGLHKRSLEVAGLRAALDVRVPDVSVALPGPRLARLADQATRRSVVGLRVDGGLVRVSGQGGETLPGTVSPPDPNTVGSVLSSDGTEAAIAAPPTGAVELRDSTTSMLRLRIWGSRRATALAFSPDGRLLAVGQGAEVGVYDVDTGREQDRLRGSRGTVRDLSWSSDGVRIWAIAGRSRISSWRWLRARVLADDPAARFVGIFRAPGRDRFLAVESSGRLRLLSLRSSTERMLRTRARDVIAADLSGRLVALAGRDGVWLVDVRSERTRVVDVARCLIGGVALSRDQTTLHVSCADGELRSFDVAGLVLRRRVPIPAGPLRLAALPSGDVLTGGLNGTGSLIRAGARDSELTHRAAPGAAQFAVAASLDGRRAVVAGLGAGKPMTVFAGRGGGGGWEWDRVVLPSAGGSRAYSAAFSPDGELMALGLHGGKVVLLGEGEDLEAGPVWTDLPGAVTGLSFSRDGRRLVVATASGLIGTMPACSGCSDPRTLARLAAARLGRARDAGLVVARPRDRAGVYRSRISR